jgi:hypothetical protein
MNHSGRKMYQGSIFLSRKPEKTFSLVIGFCFLASFLTCLIILGLAM